MSFYNDGYAHGFAAGHAQALHEERVKDAPDVVAGNGVDDHHPWKRWAPVAPPVSAEDDVKFRYDALEMAEAVAERCAAQGIKTQQRTTERAAAYYHFLTTGTAFPRSEG